MVLFSCTSNSNSGVHENQPNAYKSLEIFCWCYLYDKEKEKLTGYPSYELVGCNPTSAVNPRSLLSDTNCLIFATKESLKINQFTDLFLKKRDSISLSTDAYPDARVVFLFKKSNSLADTFVLAFGRKNQNKLYFNTTAIWHYNNAIILDTVTALMGEQINCPGDINH